MVCCQHTDSVPFDSFRMLSIPLRFNFNSTVSSNHGGTDSGVVRVEGLRPGGIFWIPIGNSIHRDIPDAQSGWSIDMSTDASVVAVGAPGDGASEQGSVQVVTLQDERWVQLGQILVGVGVGDRFGTSLSLSDDGMRLAVGTGYETPGIGTEMNNYAKLFQYSQDIDEWVQTGGTIGSSKPPSVALSADGNRLVFLGTDESNDTLLKVLVQG